MTTTYKNMIRNRTVQLTTTLTYDIGKYVFIITEDTVKRIYTFTIDHKWSRTDTHDESEYVTELLCTFFNESHKKHKLSKREVVKLSKLIPYYEN